MYDRGKINGSRNVCFQRAYVTSRVHLCILIKEEEARTALGALLAQRLEHLDLESEM